MHLKQAETIVSSRTVHNVHRAALSRLVGNLELIGSLCSNARLKREPWLEAGSPSPIVGTSSLITVGSDPRKVGAVG